MRKVATTPVFRSKMCTQIPLAWIVQERATRLHGLGLRRSWSWRGEGSDVLS